MTLSSSSNPVTLGRIDKLFLDKDDADPTESRKRRAEAGLSIAAGDDVADSRALQLALLTAVNLGARTFADACSVYASQKLYEAPLLVPLVQASSVGAALGQLGARLGTPGELQREKTHLILCDSGNAARGLRATFDGWRVAIGPSMKMDRFAERAICPVAGIAMAAIAVSEVFAEFAALSPAATRRTVSLNLWRPDRETDDDLEIGEAVTELPSKIAVFGLGHLGQAYLWAYAALPHADPAKATLFLCDDDIVEIENCETGAITSSDWLGKLKTRMAASWLERQGFKTRMYERRLDEHFRTSGTDRDPVIAVCGFDDNQPRQWLAHAGYRSVFDAGLGATADNFDVCSFHRWPNPRSPIELWPVPSAEDRAADELKQKKKVSESKVYSALDSDECGSLRLAGKSVAVPFVGALASAVVFAEILKATIGGPTFHDLKLRACSLNEGRIHALLATLETPPVRGLSTHRCVV